METSQQEFKQENSPVPSGVKNFPYDERLSSWEMSQLWVIYQGNSSNRCILQFFEATAQDPEIKAVFNDAINIITPQLNTITNLFNSVGFPLPYGFGDEDVELKTKRLYSVFFASENSPLLQIKFLTPRWGILFEPLQAFNLFSS